MLTVTDKAYIRIIELREEEGKDSSYNLRAGVIGGGCSGLSYQLKFDDSVKDGDVVVKIKDIKIIVDKKSLLYLIGTELDYSDGLNGKGLIFNNPNASRTCGCGESFGV
jgi:iron-sulfur cluster assembly protein